MAKGKRILSLFCIALLLFVVVGVLLPGEIRFSVNPKDWRFSRGDLLTLYDARGNEFGTLRESHIGPITIWHYGPQKQLVERATAADESMPSGSGTNRTSSATEPRR